MSRTIFVCYQRDDHEWVTPDGPRDLVPWLSRTLCDHGVEVWYDPKLNLDPGINYREKIHDKINSADAAILLISEGFFTSVFIKQDELPLIKRRHDAGRLRIIPILVANVTEATRQQHSWIFERQMLPPRFRGDQRSLTEIRTRRKVWEDVRVQIKAAILNALDVGAAPPSDSVASERRSHRSRLALPLAVVSLALLAVAAVVLLRPEHVLPASSFPCSWEKGDGQEMSRASATAKRSQLLKRGESAQWTCRAPTPGRYAVRWRCSNDQSPEAPPDRLAVSVSSKAAGNADVASTGQHGEGWNTFVEVGPLALGVLDAGTHVVSITVAACDDFGVEIDKDSVQLVRLGSAE